MNWNICAPIGNGCGAPNVAQPSSEPGSSPGKISGAGARIAQRLVHRARRLDLRGRQAALRLAGLALDHLRIELARARVLDDAVVHAVEGVAGVERRVVDGRVLLGGMCVASPRCCCCAIHIANAARPVVSTRRRAGDDAVEVVGIALRRHDGPGVRRPSSPGSSCGRGAVAVERRVMALALTVISCTARWPKSISFSGRCIHGPPLPWWPVSVAVTA